MSTEIKTWEILNGELRPIETTLSDNGRKETEHLEKWIKTKPDEIIIGEGDRLNSREFFRACGDDLTIIHLTVADTTREKRYKERGSEQSEKFIQTTRSKCKNVLEEFGPRATLFGEERGCVVEFPHETPEDTQKIVDWFMSVLYQDS